ncbi:NAD(P)H-binding protein [Limosilactobacillus ingluviei]|uniref:NAD(P)H-binding protein n=1 Tax=Limosilactobacillus ingluviei TaxID=148604 RepID=UPI0002D84CEC|nr:NAD(P)H-binding protein [Limosilactobacillus ingluviei]
MKMVIFAANGQIARLVEDRILNEAQFENVELTLVLRNAKRLQDLAPHPRVTVVEGDLNDPAVVEQGVAGQDLVFNAVVDHDVANRPTKNLIAAMKAQGVDRLILTNILGIYDEVPGEFGRWNREYCFGGEVKPDNPMVQSDQLAAASGLTYTTLRLPWLNDRDEVKYTITHRHEAFVGVSGSRQSIADVVLKIVADPSFGQNDSLGIADPATAGARRPVY